MLVQRAAGAELRIVDQRRAADSDVVTTMIIR